MRVGPSVWGPPSCERLLCGCCVGVVNLTFSIKYSRIHSCGRRQIVEPRKYCVFLSLLSLLYSHLIIIGVCTVTTNHNNWYQNQVLEASSSMTGVDTSPTKFDFLGQTMSTAYITIYFSAPSTQRT
jgi:hypothetical protein